MICWIKIVVVTSCLLTICLFFHLGNHVGSTTAFLHLYIRIYRRFNHLLFHFDLRCVFLMFDRTALTRFCARSLLVLLVSFDEVLSSRILDLEELCCRIDGNFLVKHHLDEANLILCYM